MKAEWCDEERLLKFAGFAEEFLKYERRRPRGWVDVIGEALKKRAERVADEVD